MSTIGIDNVAEVYEQTQKFIANYGFITKNLKALKSEGANSSKQSLDSNLYSFGVPNVASGDLKRDKVDRKNNNRFKVLPKKKEKPKAKKTQSYNMPYESYSYDENVSIPTAFFGSNNPNVFFICLRSIDSRSEMLCLNNLYEATDKIAKANDVLKSDLIPSLCSSGNFMASQVANRHPGRAKGLLREIKMRCSELEYISPNFDNSESNELASAYRAEIIELLKFTQVLLASPKNVLIEMSWPRDI